jgi:DNA primase
MSGLLRYPKLIATKSEAIGRLVLGDERLERVRSVALDAAFASGTLEKAALETILQNTGLGVVAEELRATNGLAFSFLRGNADPERAERDLSAAIDAMVARPVLDAALAEVTERLRSTTDDAGLAEQLRLRSARDESDRALAALADGEDEQGA